MADAYRVLHYAGDVTELGRLVEVPASGRMVPVLLGVDAVGAPYEVLDAELLVDETNGEERTRVHLGPADVATQRGNKSRLLSQRADAADQRAHEARVRHFWRPDLWPNPEPSHQAREAMAATEAAKAAALEATA